MGQMEKEHRETSHKVIKLHGENTSLRALLMETAMRGHFALPRNEQQEEWFDTGPSTMFRERLYNTLEFK